MAIRILAVAAGGAAGSILRYLISHSAARVAGTGIPLGTLMVNATGCLAAGLVFGLAEERAALSPIVRLLLLTGFLGGFTTFCAFAAETVTLVRDGSWFLTLANIAANNLAGVGFALAGVYLGRMV